MEALHQVRAVFPLHNHQQLGALSVERNVSKEEVELHHAWEELMQWHLLQQLEYTKEVAEEEQMELKMYHGNLDYLEVSENCLQVGFEVGCYGALSFCAYSDK